jgi:opine dehydrogenase
MKVAVLGGGNGAHAAVIDLALKGCEVVWWRRGPIPPVLRYSGRLGEGEVVPSRADDLAAAVGGAELVLAPIPAFGVPELLSRLAPLLAPGQAVAFTPGTFATWLGAGVRPDVVFLETGTLPYLVRVVDGVVKIADIAARLPIGSIPGEGPSADAAHARFASAYPSAVRVSDGLDAALCNWGPVIHPPLVVENLGAIESLGDRFDIHSEGTSPAVRRTVLALDAERIALRRALGIPGEHWPIATHYDRSPLGMYSPDAHDRLVASGLWRESLSLDHRYLTEDVLCGLVLTVSLGRLAAVPMPVGEGLLALLRAALDRDPFRTGRTAASIGAGDLPSVLRLARSGFMGQAGSPAPR